MMAFALGAPTKAAATVVKKDDTKSVLTFRSGTTTTSITASTK